MEREKWIMVIERGCALVVKRTRKKWCIDMTPATRDKKTYRERKTVLLEKNGINRHKDKQTSMH